MQERGEADFSINHMVSLQLPHQIQCHESKLLLRLHEFKTPDGPQKVISQVGAFWGCYEGGAVFFEAGAGGNLSDDIVAQRAVEVQVEFNFRQMLKFVAHWVDSLFAARYTLSYLSIFASQTSQ